MVWLLSSPCPGVVVFCAGGCDRVLCAGECDRVVLVELLDMLQAYATCALAPTVMARVLQGSSFCVRRVMTGGGAVTVDDVNSFVTTEHGLLLVATKIFINS